MYESCKHSLQHLSCKRSRRQLENCFSHALLSHLLLSVLCHDDDSQIRHGRYGQRDAGSIRTLVNRIKPRVSQSCILFANNEFKSMFQQQHCRWARTNCCCMHTAVIRVLGSLSRRRRSRSLASSETSPLEG